METRKISTNSLWTTLYIHMQLHTSHNQKPFKIQLDRSGHIYNAVLLFTCLHNALHMYYMTKA